MAALVGNVKSTTVPGLGFRTLLRSGCRPAFTNTLAILAGLSRPDAPRADSTASSAYHHSIGIERRGARTVPCRRSPAIVADSWAGAWIPTLAVRFPPGESRAASAVKQGVSWFGVPGSQKILSVHWGLGKFFSGWCRRLYAVRDTPCPCIPVGVYLGRRGNHNTHAKENEP